MDDKRDKTHFGFEEVSFAEKAGRVAEVFHTVAARYDLMNDLMSFGLHRYWKQFTLQISGVRENQKILDVAGGTGDLSRGFLKKMKGTGAVYLSDINASMLQMGRDKLLDQGFSRNIFYVQADAEKLPFAENYFDCISIGFGLRNVTRKDAALASFYQCLKPGGCLLVLEFSQPVLPLLKKVYDRYSFSVLPMLGRWLTGSAESYQYLVESIRQHPDQETLKSMILAAGFDRCEYYNLTGGIVSLHRAYKG